MHQRYLAALPALALLALFAVREGLAMRADGTTVDEPWHLGYGERGLQEGTFLRTRELNSKMPVSVLNAVPVTVARRLAAEPLSWARTLWLGRLPTVLLGVVLGWLVWLWASALYGPWGGALALFLYTFCPNFLAHSHLVTTDVATSLAVFAAVYLLWRWHRRPSRARLLAAAAMFGAAQLTKATAALLAPLFAVILVAVAVREALAERRAAAGPAGPAPSTAPLPSAPGRPAPRAPGVAGAVAAKLRRAVPLGLACGAAAILALNLGFAGEGTLRPLKSYDGFISPTFQRLAAVPLLRDLPLPLPFAYVQGLDMVDYDQRAPTWTYLHGRYSQHGFRSYFLLGLLVKVPLGTQLLLALAIALTLSRRARRGAAGAEEFLILPVLLLLAYFSLVFELDLGVRYVLPALPFIFVFAARLAAPAARGARPAWRAARAVAVGAAALWVAAASLSVHPRYLIYFNEIAGGPANGWRWLIDSNLDWDQEGDHLRQEYIPASPVHVFVTPSGPLAGRIAIGLTDLAGRDPEGAARTAWLRDAHLAPIAVLGGVIDVFDVTEADLARCCAGVPRAALIDDLAADLALAGQPIAGAAPGINVRYRERLNDGLLGAGSPLDAARTAPPQAQPVAAWFGVTWTQPRAVGRVVAYPSFFDRGPQAERFLATDYVFQSWDGAAWTDLPGTRVTGNRSLRIEHRFPRVAARGIRLVVERERNDRGEDAAAGGFRAACREIAAFAE